jgi:predicted nucleotidyltransferase
MVTLESLRTRDKNGIEDRARKHGASNVRIFGSVAKGVNHEGSDIDFLVDFEPSRTLFDLIALRLDLKELLGAEVEIVTPGSLHYIRERVLSEAIPL